MISLHGVGNIDAHKAVDVARHLVKNEVVGGVDPPEPYMNEGVVDLAGGVTGCLVT